jgi:hypothetical protein
MAAKIILNMARCNSCQNIVISASVHDFRTCKCGAISVDGGREYLKRCGNISNIVELSVMEREDGRFYSAVE